MIYYFKAKSDAKKFIGFKGPLGLYKYIKDHYTTLENAGENQKKFTSDINKRIKRGENIRGAQKCNKNIKSLWIRKESMKVFNDHPKIEAKYKIKYGEELKVLTPEQILQRFPMTFTKWKQSNYIFFIVD